MSKLNQVLLSQKQPELGLVCITTSDAVRFRTVTRKRLLQLTEIEQEKVLRELFADNLKRLDKALDFCYANKIKLYRMTSALFPFADTDLGEIVLTSMSGELRDRPLGAIPHSWNLTLFPPNLYLQKGRVQKSCDTV